MNGNGPGIWEQSYEHVLERSRKAECSTEAGTGLGLAIVKHIKELHGAELTPGTGAGEFPIFFPETILRKPGLRGLRFAWPTRFLEKWRGFLRARGLRGSEKSLFYIRPTRFLTRKPSAAV